MGRKGEGLAATPAEARHGDFSIGSRKLLAVIGGSIEIGIHDVGIEPRYGFDGGVLRWKFTRSSAVGARAR